MANETETPAQARARNVGMSLFLVYVLLYGGFMYLAAFAPEVMKKLVPGGVNVAIAYGMGLILAAFVLAAVYLFLLRPPAK
jgi:uncharacterized membrane protein (DUF485 family)